MNFAIAILVSIIVSAVFGSCFIRHMDRKMYQMFDKARKDADQFWEDQHKKHKL